MVGADFPAAMALMALVRSWWVSEWVQQRARYGAERHRRFGNLVAVRRRLGFVGVVKVVNV